MAAILKVAFIQIEFFSQKYFWWCNNIPELKGNKVGSWVIKFHLKQ